MKKLLHLASILLLFLPSLESKADNTIYIPKFSGTLRTRFEYLTQDNKGAFKVRNLRLGIQGNVAPIMSYLGEVDFSDWKNISLVNAFIKITPIKPLQFVMGQQRIPFTIAAHRMPHEEYFVNRPFLAKYGGIRDVGLMGGYTLPKIPLSLQASFFNCSGVGVERHFFTNTYGFSIKAISAFHPNWYFSASTARNTRGVARYQGYDIGGYFHNDLWHVEAEYLRRQYVHDVFKPLNAFDFFVYRNFPIEKNYIAGISGAARYDYMSDNTSGIPSDDGKLITDNPECHRLTLGATLSLQTKFQADIRLNYEKYFLKKDVVRSLNEDDRIVLEIIAHF